MNLKCPHCYTILNLPLRSYKKHVALCPTIMGRKGGIPNERFYDHEAIKDFYVNNPGLSLLAIGRQFGCDIGVVKHAIRHVRFK